MSELDPQILNLYDNIILVDEPEVSAVKESKKNENPLLFEGGLAKRLLFVYHSPTGMSPEDRKMIQNLIEQAIKYKLDEVALLNLFDNQTPPISRLMELEPKHIIFWGCESYIAANQLNESFYEVHQTGGVQFISAHAISLFHADKDLKLKLWNAIRLLLGI